MCAINLVIGKNLETVKAMHEATKHRGIYESYRNIQLANSDMSWVSYNHLPTSGNQTGGAYETENSIVWLNGFISNYKELAIEFGINLQSDRDTEVLAKLIDLNVSPNRLNGFFAVLVFDKKNKLYHSFVDRYGIKNLYTYMDENGVFYLSSEIKGIKAVVDLKMDQEAVNMWRYSLGVVGPETIYQFVRKVDKIPFTPIQKIKDESNESYERCKDQLSILWSKAIERNKTHHSSGVYLSGGVDSGMIANSMKPDFCFSVDYVDQSFSEIDLIKINTTGVHYSFIVNRENANLYAKKTISALDDLKVGSCYTNFAISELASKFCRVMYSGAGGDEFFGGYPHRNSKDLNEVIRRDSNMDLIDFKGSLTRESYDLLFLQGVLIVEDRMSGFHTMETRYPLLDNDLVDFARSLPDSFKKDKQILKDISGLDESVLLGKKKGFSNPYFSNSQWVEFVINNLK
jgi:asparagine synthase (glutamine-hydrolysing)